MATTSNKSGIRFFGAPRLAGRSVEIVGKDAAATDIANINETAIGIRI
ncbi:hypothetical protein [Methylomonas rivi]|uniref:Uncharacterized protein n=1 Tax=Methylomonas rivi TaxID=2952226 RepID=A0ABT1U3J0_9GAMM|nr:hypothetical protein [Methylomonas sp. WSC-6]MCQ8128365.1 hypothetical protein [Methylomonas sp. WSC-6]